MAPLYWLGIVFFSWSLLLVLYTLFTPPVVKEPPLPPLFSALFSLPW